MKPLPAKYFYFLFFLSVAYTLLLNALNIHSIKKLNPENNTINLKSMVFNSTVYSIDNYWYVNQVKNLVLHNKFTVDINKPFYEVRRAPVYPWFYGLHYLAFGEEGSYFYIRYTQTIILALSVLALFAAMNNFTGKPAVAWITAGLYLFHPVMAISAFYTVTESLSIPLVCFFLYYLSLCKQPGKKIYWLVSGFFFALAVLCRPTLVFMALSFALALWLYSRGWKALLIHASFAAAGALCLFAPWAIRNYKVTGGDIVFLEKFYGDPMDYGMPNIYLREWIACWMNPADYTSEYITNTMMDNLVSSAHPLPEKQLIESYMKKMPERAFAGNGRDTVYSALLELYHFYQSKTTRQPLAEIQDREGRAAEKIKNLKLRFKEKNAFGYYVMMPLYFLKSIVFQSNAMTSIFLNGKHISFLQRLIKLILFGINILAWFSLLIFPFWEIKKYDFHWMSVLFVIPSLAAFIYMLHYLEARYCFTMFPFLFGVLAIHSVHLYTCIIHNYLKREKI